MNNNYKHNKSSLYLLLLNWMNIPIPEELNLLFNYAFLSFVILLLVIINLFFLIIYFIIIYTSDIYNLEDKCKNYPKILKLIKFYKTTRKIYVILDIFISLILLISLFIYTLIILGIPIL